MAGRNPIGVMGKSGSTAVPVTSTTDTRLALAGLLRRTTGVRARTGILRGPTGANLQVSGSNAWAYTLEAGQLVVAPDPASGAYIIPQDAAGFTVPTLAKPGTGSRIDIIYMGISDAWDRGQAATAVLIGVANGTASAGTPTPPAIPDGCVELARNTMSSTATTTASSGNVITNTCPFTTTQGGVTYYRNQAEQDADTLASGDRAYRIDLKALIICDDPTARTFQPAGQPQRVGSANERDAYATALGNAYMGLSVYRLDKSAVQTFYTQQLGVPNAGWYWMDAQFNLNGAEVNPIPLAPVIVPNTAVTFTIGPGEYMQIEVSYRGVAQLNVGMQVNLEFSLNGTIVASSPVQGDAAPRVPIASSFRLFLSAGTHTLALSTNASAAGASVMYNARWGGLSVSPVLNFA